MPLSDDPPFSIIIRCGPGNLGELRRAEMQSRQIKSNPIFTLLLKGLTFAAIQREEMAMGQR